MAARNPSRVEAPVIAPPERSASGTGGFWAVWSWLGRSRPALRDARRAELVAGTRLIDGRVARAVPITLRAPHRVGTEIVL